MRNRGVFATRLKVRNQADLLSELIGLVVVHESVEDSDERLVVHLLQLEGPQPEVRVPVVKVFAGQVGVVLRAADLLPPTEDVEMLPQHILAQDLERLQSGLEALALQGLLGLSCIIVAENKKRNSVP